MQSRHSKYRHNAIDNINYLSKVAPQLTEAPTETATNTFYSQGYLRNISLTRLKDALQTHTNREYAFSLETKQYFETFMNPPKI